MSSKSEVQGSFMTHPEKRSGRPYSREAKRVASLPFSIDIATSTKDLEDVLRCRSEAYGRHIPELAKALSTAEPIDLRPDCVLLVARSKSSGLVVGSMRLNCNLVFPLQLEDSLSLPDELRNACLLEARRLTIASGPEGQMVAPALIKAAYEYSFRFGIDHAIVTARRPVDRMYRLMQFSDLLNGQTVPLSDAANLPHSVFIMPIVEADARWRQAHCPMYEFMAETVHPDIHMDHALFARRMTGLHTDRPGLHAPQVEHIEP